MIAGQLVQMVRAESLGQEDVPETLGGQRREHAVVQHSRGMEDRPQRLPGRDGAEQALDVSAFARVAGQHGDGGAGGGEFGREPSRLHVRRPGG